MNSILSFSSTASLMQRYASGELTPSQVVWAVHTPDSE